MIKQAANQWNMVSKLEEERDNAKASLEAAQWMFECAVGTKMEADFKMVVDHAQKAYKDTTDRLHNISSEARSLSNHYAKNMK